jgi:hypothetical protein
MKVLRKEITWILIFKVILLTLLWWLCFSKPEAPPQQSRQVFFNHVYGGSDHVSFGNGR